MSPFCALFTFAALLSLTRHRNILAACLFAFNTAFRANGVINAGFFVWYLMIRKRPSTKNWTLALLCMCITVSPFIAFQVYGYRTFCMQESTERQWCSNTLPLVYSYVQSHYWYVSHSLSSKNLKNSRDVGFLRYWTLQQLPLFILSAPVLIISFAASFHFYSLDPIRWLKMTIPLLQGKPTSRIQIKGFLANPALLPYLHLHTLMTCILLFNSHVQICLRLVALDPVVFWYAATLLETNSRYGFWWIRYCLIWSPVSVLLWAGFYPPA